jgi:hypothetical protein
VPAPRRAPAAGTLARARVEHPYASVGIAFAVGAIAGVVKELLLRRAPKRTPFSFGQGNLFPGLRRKWI